MRLWLVVFSTISVGSAGAKAAKPPGWVSFVDLKSQAHAAGLKAIFDVWSTYITSTTHEKYADFYGRFWDTIHQVPNARPAPTRNEVAKPVFQDAARLDRLSDVLAKTKTGREALSIVERYNVDVQFIQDSQAGYFDSARNLIAIGALIPDRQAVNTLLHEINHSLTRGSGIWPDANKLSRAQYVDEFLKDEARSDGLVAVGARDFARINRGSARSGTNIDVAVQATTTVYSEAYRKTIFAGRASRQSAVGSSRTSQNAFERTRALLANWRMFGRR